MRLALGRAAIAGLAIAAGCGGESGDLMAIELAGGPGGGARTIVVTNDGRARCDGGELRSIASDDLIDAREIERELQDLAEAGRELGGPRGGRRYTARLRAGTVRWAERAPGKPEPLARVELLALRLGRELC